MGFLKRAPFIWQDHQSAHQFGKSWLVLIIFLIRALFPFQASFVLLFSLICFAFCIISLVYLLGEVNVNLNRLQACWFNNIDDSCTCYTKEQFGFKTFRFSKVANCEVIKGQLRQLVYGVTITFAIGCLISLIAVVTTGYLLCKNQRWKVRFRVWDIFRTLSNIFKCINYRNFTCMK